MIKLPKDNPSTFPGVPLSGHICSLRRDNQKLYWRVEQLIADSAELEVREVSVDDLLSKIGNGTWFGPNERPTIRAFIDHLDRALAADLRYPIILTSDGKVMDGSHRILAAKLKGMKTVPAVQFSTDPEPEYIEEVSGVGG